TAQGTLGETLAQGVWAHDRIAVHHRSPSSGSCSTSGTSAASRSGSSGSGLSRHRAGEESKSLVIGLRPEAPDGGVEVVPVDAGSVVPGGGGDLGSSSGDEPSAI